MKKQTNGKYTINVKTLFRNTVNCQFRNDRNDKGKKLNHSPFDEIMFFIKNDLEDAFLSIETIAKEHGRKSILVNDVIEYYSLVGRPQLYKRD